MSTQHNSRSFVLGETADIMRLHSLDDFRLADLRMIQQARRSICLLTPDLEPSRFDNEEFLEALSAFVRSHPRATARIVVGDPLLCVQTGHGIIRLMQRLSSKISIRQADPDRYDGKDAFLVADGTGIVRRQGLDSYAGYVDAKSLSTAPTLVRQFDELFEFGKEIADFRRLAL